MCVAYKYPKGGLNSGYNRAQILGATEIIDLALVMFVFSPYFTRPWFKCNSHSTCS